MIKGEIDTPKHVLENIGMVFLENNIIGSSSVSVDYKIGKTYKVFVMNGDTNYCTTKITIPPTDYMWEPNMIIINQGDTVVLEITNLRKNTHTFSIPEFGVNTQVLEPRVGTDTVIFVADTAGVFTFSCGLPYNPDKLYCDSDHSMMTGTLIVLE